MIGISRGADVVAFLDRVTGHPERYAEVLICTPFIDAAIVPTLARLAVAATERNCGVRFITAPAAGKLLAKGLPGHAARWRRSIVVRRHLHSKAYVAIARRGLASEAIVTSANLTESGVDGNIELGIKAVATSAPGRTVVAQVHDFLKRVVRVTGGGLI
jgi:hypothetical protein